MIQRTLGLVLGLALLSAGPAQAQDLQNFKPAPGTWNLFSVDTAYTAPAGRFVPTLWVNFGLDPLVRRNAEGDVTEKIIETYTTLDVVATYGVTEWFEVGLDLPVSDVTGDGLALLGGDAGVGIGDLRLVPKVRLPARLGGVIGLALALPVSLPTGDDTRGMGAGTTGINPKGIVDARFGGITVTANVGFRARLDEAVVDSLALGNEITYGAGVAAELGSPAWVGLAELFGAAPANSLETENAAPLEALLGARWFAPFGGVITLGGGMGLISDYGSPDVRVVLGLGFFELPDPVGDRDGDGLLDPDDQCPDDPEDKDAFEDADGCPDPDNDGDGVLDVDDRCPRVPEDRDGFEDADGCPDPDNDQDQIRDVDDACPNAPEDMDAFEDANGCPDPDNDQDTILDVDDACPNEPETKNGYKDEDGCPDRKVEVKVTEGKLLVLEPVFFDFDKATIKAESLAVLDAVAETLVKHSDINLRVEGHTDSKGTHGYNDALSQSRVEAVVEYLVQKGGVAADRLTPKGYGKRRPLVDPGTPGADAKNRRVEFVIVR